MSKRVGRWIGDLIFTGAFCALVVFGWNGWGLLGAIASVVVWRAVNNVFIAPALVHWLKRQGNDVEADILDPQRDKLRRWGA